MNYNLKKYFYNINFFFLFLISILAVINFFLDLPSTYIYIFCFLLIATVGVSHGAYDGKAGEKLFFNKYKKWKFIFYFAYIALAILVFVIWYLNPLISLIIFLTVSSLHFGKEDLEIYLDKKYKLNLFIFFLKGSLIILLPLFFNFEQTNLIFNTILFSKGYVLLSNNYIKFILILNLIMQSLFYLYFYLKKKLFISLFFLIKFDFLENSIEKIIFIGLASLTLPHVILHYIAENIKISKI
jgi:hypothetical protein